MAIGSMTKGFLSFSELSGDGDLSTDMIIDQFLDYNLFYKTKNRYPFISMLNMMDNQAKQSATQIGKKVSWAFGDEEPTTIPIGDLTAATIDLAATTFTIDGNEFGYLTEGTILSITGVDGSDSIWADLRISNVVVNGAGTLTTITYVVQATNDDTADVTVGSINITSHSNTWDGAAGPGTSRRPDSLHNYIQHSRETVTVGEYSQAEDFVVDLSLMKQASDKLEQFLIKENKKLYTGHYTGIQQYGDLEGNTVDAGIAAGLPHFLQPELLSTEVTATLVTNGLAAYEGVTGANFVSTATSFTYAVLEEWANELARFGGDDKIIFGSPSTLSKVVAGLRAVGLTVNVSEYNFPGTQMIWDLETIEMQGSRWIFAPDYCLDDLPVSFRGIESLTDLGHSAFTGLTKNYIIGIDPIHVGRDALKTDKGDKKVKMVPVEGTNNSTYEKMEIDQAGALIVTEPRACGYLAIGGTRISS